MWLFTKNGRTVSINEDECLGLGHEGAVYPASSWSVVKTLEKRRRSDERKIDALAEIGRRARNTPLNRVVWPLHSLYTGAGDFAGFEMLRIPDAVTLAEQASYEDWPLQDRQHAAWQLSRLYRCLHSVGIFVGDGKLANSLYKESTGDVYIVDTNSLHLPTFPGSTVTIDYVRPAIARIAEAKEKVGEGACYPVSRTSDNHCLAVQIFLLLVNAHPFGAGATIEECVSRGECAFPYRNFGNRKRLPPGPFYRTWRRLPDRLQAMFSAAFHGDRAPEPSEWEDAFSSSPRQRRAK